MFLFLINLANASHYEHFATWEKSPDIYICGQNTQSIQEVKESIKYWKLLGYNFGSIKKQHNCPKQINGAIIIKNKYFNNKQGNTYIKEYYYTDNVSKKYLDFAIIDLNNKINLYPNENKESLTHELGHALGIDHVHNKNDIMFPYANSN